MLNVPSLVSSTSLLGFKMPGIHGSSYLATSVLCNMSNIFLLKSLLKCLLVVKDLTSASIVHLVGEQTCHLIFVNSLFVFFSFFEALTSGYGQCR